MDNIVSIFYHNFIHVLQLLVLESKIVRFTCFAYISVLFYLSIVVCMLIILSLSIFDRWLPTLRLKLEASMLNDQGQNSLLCFLTFFYYLLLNLINIFINII